MALIGLGKQNDAAAPAPGAFVKDGSIETFSSDVLEAKVPVVVDFWAEWCAPCKKLGPALEAAVNAAKGKVLLVKINVDENPELAQQLRIQSIPTVYAFAGGRPVDAFMGAVPDSQVKAFVDKLVKTFSADAGDGVEELLTAADEAMAAEAVGEAAQIYAQVLQAEPGHPKAAAGLAKCHLKSGDLERAKQTLQLVRPDAAGDEAVRAVEAELALREESEKLAGSLKPLQDKVAADPSDMQARFDLALALDAAGKRDEAIDTLLGIVRRDRAWNDDAARKQLVKLFEAMGPMDKRTISARRKLSSILFS